MMGKLLPTQSLIAGGIATAVGVFMTGAGVSLESVAEAALAVGLPTVAGSDVAHLVAGPIDQFSSATANEAVNAAVAGATATGLLMGIGRMPSGLSGEALTVFLVAGVSTYAAQVLVANSDK